MSYEVEITRRAAADRDACFDYIAARSFVGAMNWLTAFESAVQSIANNPPASLAPESEHHPAEIRQRTFSTSHGLTYRVLFVVQQEIVYLIHVRGPGQDLMSSQQLDLPS
jgi:plasmid stabilization system protein ParE